MGSSEPDSGPLRRDTRIASIDAFRGLTILTMIFVNDLAGRDVPAWMKHVPPDADGMTFVDVVFPAFLFIVGMAIPLAIGRQLDKGAPLQRVVGHVFARTLGLLVIGVFMVNIHGLNVVATGISRDGWTLLLFAAVILGWNQYPRATGARWAVFLGLRVVGAAVLIGLATVYRSGADGRQWMHTSWWGILGQIGWAYLTVCLTCLIFRRRLAWLGGAMGLLVAAYIGDKTGALRFLGVVRDYLSVSEQVAGPALIAMAGAITSTFVLDRSPQRTAAGRIGSIAVWGTVLAAAGYLLRPLYGISKVHATPAWCLYCAAMCCTVYALLYWVMDVSGWKRWSVFLTPAGSNPLLAYILPSIVYAALGVAGVEFISSRFAAGWQAIAWSAAFALMMVALTGLLGRVGIRLHL